MVVSGPFMIRTSFYPKRFAVQRVLLRFLHGRSRVDRIGSMGRWPESLEVVTEARTEVVALRRSARARRLQLRVDAEGAELVVPNRGTLVQARAFLDERAIWLLESLDEVRYRQLQRDARQAAVLPDNAALCDGAWYPVELVGAHATRKRASVSLCDDHETITVRLPMVGDACPREAIEAFLRRRARREITRDVERCAGAMGASFNRIFVRDQKTRWGSCSGRGNLSFSWRTVCLPPAVREYVVIHELTHLTHMDHSETFWRAVERHCPALEAHRAWIKSHGWQVREPVRLNASS